MVKFIIIIVVLALLGGGGFFGYKKFYGDQTEGAGFVGQLENVSLKEEILLFSFEQFPDIYTAFADFNRQISLIKSEVERLTIIEQEYPQQIEIIKAEKQIWNSVMGDAKSALAVLQSEVEAVFVTYKVNIEKGRNLIKVRTPELTKISSAALKAAQSHTKRLSKKDEDKDKEKEDEKTSK